VFFENVECLRCATALGLDADRLEMVELDDFQRCANQVLAGCNWVVPGPGRPWRPQAGSDGAGLCLSCQLTRTRPADSDLGPNGVVAERFVRAEAAKRRLVFQLLELKLVIVSHREDPEGLAFDFLVRKDEPILIGHADGVITIDLAESDDSYRERMRAELGEPYRTVLGHLRHEVGHYYWQVLVAEEMDLLAGFRALFGDERADYMEALQRHYDDGPRQGWAEVQVSAYATAHPWEDWAETWAHYLHIRDTLQTAASHGVIVTGPRFQASTGASAGDRPLESSLMAAPDLKEQRSFDDILADWLPLTYALNAINRSMGDDDLYPFVLSPKVIEKLRFVHERVLR
jgi:hypothetical protein